MKTIKLHVTNYSGFVGEEGGFHFYDLEVALVRHERYELLWTIEIPAEHCIGNRKRTLMVLPSGLVGGARQALGLACVTGCGARIDRDASFWTSKKVA